MMSSTQKPKVLGFDYVEGVDEFMNDLARAYDPHEIAQSTEMLGFLLQDLMREHEWDAAELARRLQAPEDMIERLLDGRLPAHLLDNELLELIAELLHMDLSAVGAMIGRDIRDIRWDRESEIEAKERLAQYILKELSDVLFDTIDSRYSNPVEVDQARQAEYYRVIAELERIIARQRRELKFVENLISSLRDPGLSVDVRLNAFGVEDDHEKLSIIYMKSHLKRIVNHLKGIEDLVG